MKNNGKNTLHNIPKKRHNGWVAQRFNPSTVSEHLPILTTQLVKEELAVENVSAWSPRFPNIEHEKKKILSFDDMEGLRGKVGTTSFV